MKAPEVKTAYRANPKIGPGPCEGSYAWRVEREVERRFKVKHCVVVNSGTAALHCGLQGSREPRGEIITSPLTFSATASAIVLAGQTPVFADVEADTFCLSRESVRKAITNKTRGILFVHLFKGQAEAYREVASLGLPVFEDAAQAVGNVCGGAYAGGLGVFGAYSFGSRKQVSAGEGGALVTNSDEIAWQARLLMNHGENFGGPVGYNYRPNEVTCELILSELGKLKDNTPFLTPYLVEKRGPDDKPYIETTLDKFPAFKRYARGPLPVAWDLAERALCVR